MSSALSVAELAAYQRLAPNIVGADVYQHVPDEAALPIVIIGDMDGRSVGAKDDGGDRFVSLTVQSITQGEERKPCLDLIEQIEALFDGFATTLDGWELTFAFESGDAIRDDESNIYLGQSVLTILVSRA